MTLAPRAPLSSQRLDHEALLHLHQGTIEDPARIRQILERLAHEGVTLSRGMNRKVLPERARITSIEADEMLLRTENFARTGREQIFLHFVLDARPYFFAANRHSEEDAGTLRLGIPHAMYEVERRDRGRRRPQVARGLLYPMTVDEDGRDAAGAAHAAEPVEVEIEDLTPAGAGIWAPEDASATAGGAVALRIPDPASSTRAPVRAEVRSRRSDPSRPGWVRLGLALRPHGPTAQLAVEPRDVVAPISGAARLRQQGAMLAAGARTWARRQLRLRSRVPALERVEYCNAQGEAICGLIDAWGPTRGATAVLIPPAWGRTKETLLPLARTIVDTFRAAGEPVVVLRFDGIRKRGESYRDADCAGPDREHLRFTFSQGVRDIETSLDFVEQRFAPRRSVLVSFSASSIEARRVMAEHDGRLDGWVCVVGTADVQSMMRVISGGVDYIRGLEEGVRFGLQEILGVVVDVDRAGLDAIEQGLATLEDSRADFARITAPVTWIRGRHDAWMDQERIAEVLAVGDTRGRRLLDVPTGHQLQSSQEAVETFQLIASEVGRIATGEPLRPALPDLVGLAERQRAERKRLPRRDVDPAGFWKRYLLGRDGSYGIELMNETLHYRELMNAQIRALDLAERDRVLDLGSGTGAFPVALARAIGPLPAAIHEVDLVPDALARARERLQAVGLSDQVAFEFTPFDLEQLAHGAALPGGPYDKAIASLLLSYVSDPDRVLAALHAALRPGGRLVLSTLRPDADISGIYQDALAEIDAGGVRPQAGLDRETVLAASRNFLNDAARLIEFEEQGLFRFFDEAQLRRHLEGAGFVVEQVTLGFGDPPQAIVVAAQRR